jgi:trimeric autotransporter adhesin
MKRNKSMKTRNTILLASLAALGCFTVLPGARAVTPPPDGCYPNFTTAEGCNALNSLTIGAGNTGLGWRALFTDSTGNFNTAVGAGALALNNADSNTAVGATAL